MTYSLAQRPLASTAKKFQISNRKLQRNLESTLKEQIAENKVTLSMPLKLFSAEFLRKFCLKKVPNSSMMPLEEALVWERLGASSLEHF